MKIVLMLFAFIIVLVAGFFAFNAYIYNEKQGDPMTQATSTQPTVVPIEHVTGILTWGGTAIYFDPTGEAAAFAGQVPANIVLVTDIHGDHFSTSTLAALVATGTALIVPQAVADQLPADLASRATILQNGGSVTEQGFHVEAVPMYNLPGSENANFHTPGRGNGYIVERDGTRVYIAGDTAGTPEMRALQNIDIAFVPMNLPYTMSIEDAANAVLEFKPKIVYPYHYRGPDGLADVGQFKELVNAGDASIEVILAEWY